MAIRLERKHLACNERVFLREKVIASGKFPVMKRFFAPEADAHCKQDACAPVRMLFDLFGNLLNIIYCQKVILQLIKYFASFVPFCGDSISVYSATC